MPRKKDVWLFADNFILNAVKDNYTKAIKVSKFHFDALTEKQTDPGIFQLLTNFTIVHQALENAAAGKGLALGQRAGKTLNVNLILKDLVDTQLPDWQQQIRNVYPAKSAGYKALFPKGNAPYETGKKDNRILAVRTLRDACNNDAALAAVALLIVPFYTLLNDARNLQLGKKTDVGGDIETEKDAINDMARVHFQNHGALINLYPDDPDRIASFTDVTTLQAHVHGKVYTGTVNANKKKKVLMHTFTPASVITVFNTGLANLQLWISDHAKNPIHPDGITILPGQTTDIPVGNLGDYHNRILMTKNLNGSIKGSYEISVEEV